MNAVTNRPDLTYKVGFLGAPHTWKPAFSAPVEWNAANIGRLKYLGFNTIQINVAWGSRPGGEALTLEDVVELPPDLQEQYPQLAKMRGDQSVETRAWRRQSLRERIALCREGGMRTIFHFGAPYNAHASYGDAPPNCISDEAVIERYEILLGIFAREFTGVDDILIYTWDQDAWLCSEFGPCPRCLGKPLHERVVPFVERLAATWRGASLQGRLWWEPWELSAGQVFACVERINTEGFGLALHSNIAEVQATFVADRWLRNTCELASRRDIPVIVEHFLGAASEELEPFVNLSHPLVTLRALQILAPLPGVCGIKEYYGLVPDKEDPNLRMTALFFANPGISEDEALTLLAKPYGEAAAEMVSFWKEASAGMEIFPWDAYWGLRHIGTRSPAHALSAAMLQAYMGHTPSWASTRQAVFMKSDNAPPDPWMREDIQLRCRLAAERWGRALAIGKSALPRVATNLSEAFQKNLDDLAGLRRRALSHAFHLRESNLVAILRQEQAQGRALPGHVLRELKDVMQSDLDNCREENLSWEMMESAIELLDQNAERFLEQYFQEDGRP